MAFPNSEEKKVSWDTDGIHLITGTKYDELGFDKDGNDRRGFDENRIHKITHEKWDEENYDYRLFHKETGLNKYTGTKYDRFNVDQKGFDREHRYIGIFNKKQNTNLFTKITYYDLNELDYLGFDVCFENLRNHFFLLLSNCLKTQKTEDVFLLNLCKTL